MTWFLQGLALGSLVLAAGLLGGLALWAMERGQPIGFSKRGLSSWAREFAAQALKFALFPLGWIDTRPRRHLSAPGTRTPVLLLPGYGDNHSLLAPLGFFLRHKGWSWVQAINHPPARTIPEMAAGLALRVQEMQQASGAAQVDLVCHSMGGVVATWYMNHLEGAPHVRRMVAIATPFRGTKVAVFGPRRHARDLLPTASVIEKLGLPPVPTTAIRSTFDAVIIPQSSAALPETGPFTNVTVHGHGHKALLYSTEVLGHICRALED
jgi:pimeloyl-ACP methyl ester carboxylesterase